MISALACRETLERLKARRRNPKHDALYLIKSTYENGVVMYNAQQHDVTSSTWMVRALVSYAARGLYLDLAAVTLDLAQGELIGCCQAVAAAYSIL